MSEPRLTPERRLEIEALAIDLTTGMRVRQRRDGTVFWS